MVSEWKENTLGSISEIIMGQSPKGDSCNNDQHGHPLLNGPTEFGGYHPYPTQYTIDPKKFSQQGDLLFCVRGSTTGRMNWADQEYAIGRGLAAMRHKNGREYQPFLRGIIECKLPELLASATGSTFPNVSRNQLLDLEIELPPLPEQKAIAHVLGALDDRIELNRRMNETLESMAQALFKSWFGDFDPVLDNALASGKEIPAELSDRAAARAALGDKRQPLPAEIRTLFPDEFTDSAELGWIPEGWEVKTVSDFVEKLSKGTTARKVDISNAKDEPEVPFLKVKDIDDKGIIKTEKLELIPRSVHEGPLKRSVLKEGDILFSIAGTIGRTAVVPAELHDSNSNQAIAFVRSKEKSKTYFLLQLLRSENIQHRVHSRIVQAVQANVSLTELGNLPVIYACEGIINYLNEHLTGIYHKKFHLHSSSERLIKLRDTLLPKLLSGEIRIPEAEKMVAEVA
ncbi:MAG: restriction endonuclease subunit S [Proteobacteria bacterium]|nr:restriction endonuclease subunit S [Pseudomonadota bacterium]MBU1059634.1 restriction endonuclease subunit S [Pseudomonadota bacterium]